MATQAALALTLRDKCGVPDEGAFTDAKLQTLIGEAMTEHNASYDYTTLPAKEEQLVVLLAWIQVCYMRASRFGAELSVSVGGSGVDRAQPFNPFIQLARELRTRYEALCNQIGVPPGGADIESSQILQGELSREDSLSGLTLPLDTQRVPPTPVLSSDQQTNGVGNRTVRLSWRLGRMTDFQTFRVFSSSTAGLSDPSTLSENTALYPGLKTGVTCLAALTELYQTCIRLSGFDAGDVYIVVAVYDADNRLAISNEIHLTFT